MIEAQTKVETESLKIFKWFQNSYIKASSTRSHVILTNATIVQVKAGGNIFINEKTVRLLGITVDNKLSFEPHLNKTCKKVRQKLHALAKISTHISQKKLRMIVRVFITSQFS